MCRYYSEICLKLLRKNIRKLRISDFHLGFKKSEPADYEAAISVEYGTEIISH